MKEVYVLKPITFIKKRRHCKDNYPPIKLDDSFFGIYESKEEAEIAIHYMIHRDSYDDWYCFYIHKLPMNITQFVKQQSLHTWLYDHEGILIDERPYPTYIFGNYFHGRVKEKVRFKIGDIVECKGSLGIIYTLPPEHLNFYSDETDDSYTMIHLNQDFDDPHNFEHSHPECIEVFKPRFKISEKLQQQIDKIKKFYISQL